MHCAQVVLMDTPALAELGLRGPHHRPGEQAERQSAVEASY